MDSQTEFCVVLVTTPNQTGAQSIAQILLQEKLAACINCFAVESFYTWDGKLNCDQEMQLIIKTRRHLLEPLSQRVTEIHPYETPEIIALPIVDGSSAYLNWLSESTLRP